MSRCMLPGEPLLQTLCRVLVLNYSRSVDCHFSEDRPVNLVGEYRPECSRKGLLHMSMSKSNHAVVYSKRWNNVHLDGREDTRFVQSEAKEQIQDLACSIVAHNSTDRIARK